MDIHEVLNHARDAMTVKRVFGDPYEKDGVTVIPVANVMGGAGGGGGSGAGAPSDAGDAAVADAAPQSGYGIGYGMRATPAGVYVIKNGEVEWKPALDVNRVALQRTGAIIAGLLVLRSIIRTLVRR
jgi:uncharacterized spore protein YtfJ